MPKKILLADIDMSNRKRPIDPDYRDLMAAAIEERGGGVIGEGFKAPFVIRPVGDKWKGVTGGHRHAALVLLGWTEVEVGKHVIIDDKVDELTAKIDELDENLIRNELNPLDRALFLAERKVLCVQRRQGRGGDRKSAKFKEEIKAASCRFDLPPRFTEEVAEKTGLSERSIKRLIDIAEKLDEQAIADLRGTKIERNQQALLAFTDWPAAEQRSVAKLIKKGEAKTPAEARVALGLDREVKPDLQTRVIADALRAWDLATPISRKAILEGQGAVLKKKGEA